MTTQFVAALVSFVSEEDRHMDELVNGLGEMNFLSQNARTENDLSSELRSLKLE